MELTNHYLHKRPYRKKSACPRENRFVVGLMEAGLSASSDTYWNAFGYEIGGPVCYGYVRWILDEIERSHPDITDVLFVARDGWLLKQVFDMLPHPPSLKTHYIYAPRTMNLLCQDEDTHAAYRQYLAGQGLGSGTLAVVDTATMKFSSQRLIDSSTEQKTHGFFWLTLDGAKDYGASLSYSAYQSAHYHTIRCWNMMEFIMTSPEPPIRTMEGSKPVYRSANAFEAQRSAIFSQIEKGVLAFADEIRKEGSFPVLSNRFVTEWVNAFQVNPAPEDLSAFESTMFSEREDHSDNIPLDPFGQKRLSLKALKDRLWHYSQRHKNLYRVLHAGNVLFKRAKAALIRRGRPCTEFNGSDPIKMAELFSRYDVVSFDIFDTLIRRDVPIPTDLFYRLEEANGLFDFHDNRILAEADARWKSTTPNGEINISDIYRELSEHYILDAEKMIQDELAAEKASCSADPAMYELYRLLLEKGCRMVAVSDMYLPGKVLRDLLDGCGYTGIEHVFVSCDCGMNKGNGALQRFVQSEMGDSLRFIHIGDNRLSDVDGSESAGWSAVWYRKKK